MKQKIYLRMAIVLFVIVTLLLSSTLYSQSTISNKFSGKNNNTFSYKYNNKNFTLFPIAGQTINPYNLYNKEPAPMGIADFGIGPGNNPYFYTTDSFLSNAYVYNLSVYNSSINQSKSWVSFQLNVNLIFKNGNKLYVYWIQNVAELNTSNNLIDLVDNIWNFSSSSSSMSNATVVGEGTIGTASNISYYYSIANFSLPGNNISLAYPYHIELAVNTSVNMFGKPYLVLLYNDGNGWNAYDNVSFIFTNDLTFKPTFLVDGFGYEPTGYTLYDAEFIIGGPGNGSATFDRNSSINLNLLFWNGHNYQNVPNAFNFGTNTAETIKNVISRFSYIPQNGSIYSHITNGPGKLGILYQQNQLSTVNITTPLLRGILYVNGSKYMFINNNVNVTLFPSGNSSKGGFYNFLIRNLNGTEVWSKNISLFPGEHLNLDLSVFSATFIEQGIPRGVYWHLQLSNGDNFYSSKNNITVDLQNGTYNYSVFIENEKLPVTGGSFIINGKNVTIEINITVAKYPAIFSEIGLPSGINWSIMLNGFQFDSDNQSLDIYLPNGTYNFSVAPIEGFKSNLANGSFNIDGKSSFILIKWELIYYNITFVINGTEKGSLWGIDINGTNFYGQNINKTEYSNSSYLTILIPNGSYSFSIIPPSGLASLNKGGMINVSGSNLTVSIQLSKSKVTEYVYVISINGTEMVIVGLIILILGTLISFLLRKR